MEGGGKDILIVFGLIAGVFLLWVIGGGPARMDGGERERGIEQRPIENGDESEEEELQRRAEEYIGQTLVISPYSDWIRLGRGTARDAFYPFQEYITLTLTQRNVNFLFISDWILENSRRQTERIGEAAYTPFVGQVNRTHPVVLSGGDRLTISSGRSPIGVSFRVNKCSGYLEQFQNFVPPLPRRCPRPTQMEGYRDLSRECQSFIQTIPQCEANIRPVPIELGTECRDFINTRINYNSCVLEHRDDNDFHTNEWRIYLGREEAMWLDRDNIILLDEDGKLVGTTRY